MPARSADNIFSSKIGASSAWILAACTQIKTQHGVLTIKARNESKAKKFRLDGGIFAMFFE